MKIPNTNAPLESRRSFLKKGSAAALALGMGSSLPSPARAASVENALPRWRGFNLLDFFSPNPATARPATQEQYFQWMADWGFDFVRIPMAYPSYLKFDRSRPIKPEEVYQIDESMVERIDDLVSKALKYKLHVSLNLHRAPGYCVNAGFHEPYNLWTDQEALDAFCFHWQMWAKRYQNLGRDQISFDLVNEPSMREDMNDQHSQRSSVPGLLYRKLALAASQAIREVNPDRIIVADGNDVGKSVIPEITDLAIGQSCRGYYPGIISHYKAPWAHKDPDSLPEPQWPGTITFTSQDPETGLTVTRDQVLERAMLEDFYAPWIALKNQGVGVHCGECGCWNKTPHPVFLAWFEDVLDILTTQGIGYGIWEFSGSFGVMDSGREDVAYEDWYGHKLDRKMLNLLMKY
jgi:aryl-phospho-beta-D-glucosidase BglC (GH1 family)